MNELTPHLPAIGMLRFEYRGVATSGSSGSYTGHTGLWRPDQFASPWMFRRFLLVLAAEQHRKRCTS